MLKSLQLRDDTDYRYESRKEGRRALASIEDYVDSSIQRLEKYIKKSKELLITAASISNSNIMTNRKTTKPRKQKWEEKQLNRYFKRQTAEIALKNT